MLMKLTPARAIVASKMGGNGTAVAAVSFACT